MTFRANKNGTWVGGDDQTQGTVVYGKSGGNWLYAKEVFAKKDGTWTRAWTDCRQHDAGGRDWSSSSSAVTVSCSGCDSCGTNTKVVTTVTYTKTGCPTYTRSSETGCTGCTGSWVAQTGDLDFSPSGGKYYFYDGVAGYYIVVFDDCRSCPSNCFTAGHYYITRCSVSGEYRIVFLSCDLCQDFFGGLC